ncbi:hypothetical protein ACSBR2_021268 [Camellia fascicularis]
MFETSIGLCFLCVLLRLHSSRTPANPSALSFCVCLDSNMKEDNRLRVTITALERLAVAKGNGLLKIWPLS